MNNRAANLIKISPKEQKNYIVLEEGEKLRAADLIHIEDDEYAQVSVDSILLKSKANKHNKILRRK